MEASARQRARAARIERRWRRTPSWMRNGRARLYILSESRRGVATGMPCHTCQSDTLDTKHNRYPQQTSPRPTSIATSTAHTFFYYYRRHRYQWRPATINSRSPWHITPVKNIQTENYTCKVCTQCTRAVCRDEQFEIELFDIDFCVPIVVAVVVSLL